MSEHAPKGEGSKDERGVFNPHDLAEYSEYQDSEDAAEGSELRRKMALQSEHEQRDDPRAYGNHWKTHQQEVQESNPALADVCGRNQSQLERAQREMLKPDASLDQASEWYLRLGALSRLEGAEHMLVYAANLPVNRKRSAGYSPEEQRLNSGCMLMEASLANERSRNIDPARQAQYENEAQDTFTAVIKQSPHGHEGYLAKLYLSDLQMRQAGRMLAQAKSSGDEGLMVQAREGAMSAQDSLGALLEETNGARVKLHRLEQGELRGREVELSVLWLLRERYLAKGQYDTHYAHQAFPRQDWPKDGMLPNHQPRQSYDAEVLVKDQRGVGIIPIQIKSSEMGKGEGYDPRVVMMVDDRRDTDGIVKAVTYKRRNISGGRERVNALSAGMERALVTRLHEKRAAREAARG